MFRFRVPSESAQSTPNREGQRPRCPHVRITDNIPVARNPNPKPQKRKINPSAKTTRCRNRISTLLGVSPLNFQIAPTKALLHLAALPATGFSDDIKPSPRPETVISKDRRILRRPRIHGLSGKGALRPCCGRAKPCRAGISCPCRCRNTPRRDQQKQARPLWH